MWDNQDQQRHFEEDNDLPGPNSSKDTESSGLA
jgi:hypothetical protein